MSISYLNPMPPEAPKEADITGALRLLLAVGDVKATSATIKRLAESAAEAREQIAKAEQTLAELDRKDAIVRARLETADELIAKKHADADKRVEADRKAFDESVASRLKDLEARERQVEAAHVRNVELHEDLERRLSLVRQASV